MGGWEQRASLGTRKLGLRPRERHSWCSAVPALRGQPRGLLPGARLGGKAGPGVGWAPTEPQAVHPLSACIFPAVLAGGTVSPFYG